MGHLMAYLALVRRFFAAVLSLSLLGVCMLEAEPLASKETFALSPPTNSDQQDDQAEDEAKVSPSLQPWYHLTPQTHITSSPGNDSFTDQDRSRALSNFPGSFTLEGFWFERKGYQFPKLSQVSLGLMLTEALPTRAP